MGIHFFLLTLVFLSFYDNLSFYLSYDDLIHYLAQICGMFALLHEEVYLNSN